MLSIVICSVDAQRFRAVTAQYQQALPAGVQCELVGVHDARSLCEGYTRGLAMSHGDVVIFSHDDVEIWTPEFLPRLLTHMERFDALGVAGTRKVVGPGWFDSGPAYSEGIVPHVVEGQIVLALYGMGQGYRAAGGMQALDGLFMAFRRDAIEKVGWDAENFTGFHLYDMDTSFRAYKAGLRVGVALDLGVMHLSHGSFGEEWKKYAEVWRRKHAGTYEERPVLKCQPAMTLAGTRENALMMWNEYLGMLREGVAP